MKYLDSPFFDRRVFLAIPDQNRIGLLIYYNRARQTYSRILLKRRLKEIMSGTVTDGLYQGGEYSGGTLFSSFTVSSPVTTVGTGGGRGPRR